VTWGTEDGGSLLELAVDDVREDLELAVRVQTEAVIERDPVFVDDA
jgi:hypothetical protein